MKESYYWVILGIALGVILYLGDKYIF